MQGRRGGGGGGGGGQTAGASEWASQLLGRVGEMVVPEDEIRSFVTSAASSDRLD